MVGGLGRSFGTIGSNEFPDASVGLALALPIGNRTAKADAVIAEAQKRQLLTRRTRRGSGSPSRSGTPS